MIICLLKIDWFASFKNIRISLYILYRDFQIHFSIDFSILLKLPFCIENQYKFFYWKSIVFCQQHFLPKIYTKFSIGFTVHFELAILYWKPIQMFPLKINWFLSASFSQWKSRFCIEKQYKCSHWKSIAFCQHHFPTENQYKIFLYIIF